MGLIYASGDPDSARLSSSLPPIVHQCHSRQMKPLIPVIHGGELVVVGGTTGLLQLICKDPSSK